MEYHYSFYDNDDRFVDGTTSLTEARSIAEDTSLHMYTEKNRMRMERFGMRFFKMFDDPIEEWDTLLDSTDDHIGGQVDMVDCVYYDILRHKTNVGSEYYCVRGDRYDAYIALQGMQLSPENGEVMIDGHICRCCTIQEAYDNDYRADQWRNYVIV